MRTRLWIKWAGKMFYLSIFTFDNENREAVFTRHAREGEKIPDGVQLLMELVDLSKNRIFRIYEASDPKAVEEANLAWSDLGKTENNPVLAPGEMFEMLRRLKRET